MNILKFGGTSVGTAERMKALVSLISGNDRKIVVLSAMSGTTNTLVEICNALYKKENDKANDIISKLENIYLNEIEKLYNSTDYKTKGIDLIKNHFNHLRSFTMDMFTVNEEKAILAQGE
ncbi:MAG: aspartate kinase, partial [Bacteroidia bacterium]|nr:aspartate kinase [Bacteroidia bacterium]